MRFLLRKTFQGKEESKRAGGGEDSEGHMKEGTDKGAEEVWIESRWDRRPQAPPCGRRGHGGEGGGFCVELRERSCGLVGRGDCSPGHALSS